MSPGLDEGSRLGDGRYVLQGRLGTGGAATVWLADDTVLERSVAIKVLSEALASDESWLVRFRREARLAASLTHPNLVSVYDFNAESHPPYLVMEHMPGGSLYDHLQAGEEPEPERLTQDVLAALAAIHAAGIVHRDIKPGNILLAADGTACLTDFGVARPEDATSLTQTGHIPGTARYMAPELWKGHPADERSDLYATGILLRGTVDDDTPPELLSLIERLADDDPRHRPASAAEALSELEPGERTPYVPPEQVPRDEETTPRTIVIQAEEHPHRRAAILGLAALAVVAAIAIAQAIGGGGDEPSGSGRGDGSSGSQQSNSSGSGPDTTSTSQEETTAPEEEEPVDALALNQQGFDLIEAGRPDEAIPLLRRAVNSYPEGTTDLDYAYALYNYGNALYLSGQPEAAIPILEERLTFNDQTEEVQATLDAALEAAGEGSEGSQGSQGAGPSGDGPPGQEKKDD